MFWIIIGVCVCVLFLYWWGLVKLTMYEDDV